MFSVDGLDKLGGSAFLKNPENPLVFLVTWILRRFIGGIQRIMVIVGREELRELPQVFKRDRRSA